MYYSNDSYSLIYHSNNPFINLTMLLQEKNHELNASTANLFYTLLASEISKIYDINESFFCKKGREEQYVEMNIFYFLSLLNDSSDLSQVAKQNFFDTLFAAGLDIKQPYVTWSSETGKVDLTTLQNSKQLKAFLQENFQYEENDSILCRMNLHHTRNIFFATRLLEKTGFEEYQKRVQNYESLLRCTSLNSYEMLEFFHQQGININLPNKNLETALMRSRNMEMAKKLDEYGANWLLQDVNGNDAYAHFTNIHVDQNDPNLRTRMMNFAKSNMDKAIASGKHADIDENYIAERVRINLLKLVKSDKPKKELQEFIKQNKPRDMGSIYDEHGNNLAMLCVSQSNFARYPLFNQVCDITERNKKGETIVHMLLKKGGYNGTLTYSDKAYNILTEALNKNVITDKAELALDFINHSLSSSGYESVPAWIFAEGTKALSLLGFSHEEQGKWKSILSNNRQRDLSGNPATEDRKYATYLQFYIELFKKEDKDFVLNAESVVSALFNCSQTYDKAGVHYEFDNIIFSKIELLKKSLENFHISFEWQDFEARFHSKIITFVNEGYEDSLTLTSYHATNEERKKDSQKEFCHSIEPLINYLVETEQFKLIGEFSDNFRQSEHFSPEVQKALRYVNLQNDLTANKSPVKRAKI